MKYLILAFMLAWGSVQAQTLVLTDTTETSEGQILYRWYHEKFLDSDDPLQMVSNISLIKEFHEVDTVIYSREKTFNYKLREGDSLQYPPQTGQWYSYSTVKQVIYTSNEDMKRQLSLFHLLNNPKRLFE